MTRALFCHLFFSFWSGGRSLCCFYFGWNLDSHTSSVLSASLQSVKLLKWEIWWTFMNANYTAFFKQSLFRSLNWLQFISLSFFPAFQLKTRWTLHELTLITVHFSAATAFTAQFIDVINLKGWLLSVQGTFEEKSNSSWGLRYQSFLMENFIKGQTSSWHERYEDESW